MILKILIFIKIFIKKLIQVSYIKIEGKRATTSKPSILKTAFNRARGHNITMHELLDSTKQLHNLATKPKLQK